MLVLRRKIGESILLNGNISVSVLEVEGGKAKRVKLGVSAPPNVSILRQELYQGTQDQQEDHWETK